MSLRRAVRAFIDPELQQGKWTFEGLLPPDWLRIAVLHKLAAG